MHKLRQGYAVHVRPSLTLADTCVHGQAGIVRGAGFFARGNAAATFHVIFLATRSGLGFGLRMATKFILKTTNGKFAVRDENLGVAANWSTNGADAFHFTEERAAFWLRRMNALIPNHAHVIPAVEQNGTDRN